MISFIGLIVFAQLLGIIKYTLFLNFQSQAFPRYNGILSSILAIDSVICDSSKLWHQPSEFTYTLVSDSIPSRMGFNTNAKITLGLGTIIALAFATLFIVTTVQQTHALAYDNYGADDEGKENIDQTLQQDDIIIDGQSSPNMPTGSCDMNTHEDPEDFLLCLNDN